MMTTRKSLLTLQMHSLYACCRSVPVILLHTVQYIDLRRAIWISEMSSPVLLQLGFKE